MPLQIDLDAEAVLFDGHWLTRDDLARRIRTMLDGGDYAVTRQSQALEELTKTVQAVRTITFRATPDLVEALNMFASRAGQSVGALVRETLMNALVTPQDDAGAYAPTPPTGIPAVTAEPPAAAISSKAQAPGPIASPVPVPQAAPPPLPGNVPMPGPGALRAAGVASNTSAPSVVVEPALATETTPGQKKKDDEGRWFNS